MFSNSQAENKHIQIVYSSKDNKIFQCIKKDNSVSKNNSYNEFIFNLHIAPFDPIAPTQLGLEAQLENIASQAQNIPSNQIFQDLLGMALPPQYQTVQDFYNIVFSKRSFTKGYYSNGCYNKGKLQPDYKLSLDKINGQAVSLGTIKNLLIGQEMLLPPQPAAAPVVVATGDHLGVPPAAASDDDPIPDNIANDSSNDSDPNSLAAILDDTLKFSNNTDANTEAAVHSGENAEDTSDISS